jgi:CRP-like cAMP-binding protein
MISPEMLRRFALFAGLDPEAFKEIAMLGEEMVFEPGEWLFHEGDDADELYMILKGVIDLKINIDEKGTRQADLSTLIDGDVVGWSGLVEPYVYTLGAVATSRAQVVRLDAAGLRAMMDSNPALGYRIMTRLAQALGQRLTDLRVRFVSLVI